MASKFSVRTVYLASTTTMIAFWRHISPSAKAIAAAIYARCCKRESALKQAPHVMTRWIVTTTAKMRIRPNQAQRAFNSGARPE
jgi:hypothetical protein